MAYSQAQIKAALKSLVETVDDIGVVIIDCRTAEEDSEIVALIQSQNDGLPFGVNIVLQRMTEVEGSSGCDYIQTFGFKLETFRPYQRRRIEGTTSEAANAVAIEALAAALRASRNLGLSDLVRHMLLQTTDDMTIASLDGKGSDASLMHFGRFEVNVTNIVTV